MLERAAAEPHDLPESYVSSFVQLHSRAQQQTPASVLELIAQSKVSNAGLTSDCVGHCAMLDGQDTDQTVNDVFQQHASCQFGSTGLPFQTSECVSCCSCLQGHQGRARMLTFACRECASMERGQPSRPHSTRTVSELKVWYAD